jgi:hypothetical protein
MTGSEGYFKLARANKSVLVEHLVEITKPEKKDSSGVEFFYFQILPKHRRGGFHRDMVKSLAKGHELSQPDCGLLPVLGSYRRFLAQIAENKSNLAKSDFILPVCSFHRFGRLPGDLLWK